MLSHLETGLFLNLTWKTREDWSQISILSLHWKNLTICLNNLQHVLVGIYKMVSILTALNVTFAFNKLISSNMLFLLNDRVNLISIFNNRFSLFICVNNIYLHQTDSYTTLYMVNGLKSLRSPKIITKKCF